MQTLLEALQLIAVMPGKAAQLAVCNAIEVVQHCAQSESPATRATCKTIQALLLAAPSQHLDDDHQVSRAHSKLADTHDCQ